MAEWVSILYLSKDLNKEFLPKGGDFFFFLSVTLDLCLGVTVKVVGWGLCGVS